MSGVGGTGNGPGGTGAPGQGGGKKPGAGGQAGGIGVGGATAVGGPTTGGTTTGTGGSTTGTGGTTTGTGGTTAGRQGGTGAGATTGTTGGPVPTGGTGTTGGTQAGSTLSAPAPTGGTTATPAGRQDATPAYTPTSYAREAPSLATAAATSLDPLPWEPAEAPDEANAYEAPAYDAPEARAAEPARTPEPTRAAAEPARQAEVARPQEAPKAPAEQPKPQAEAPRAQAEAPRAQAEPARPSAEPARAPVPSSAPPPPAAAPRSPAPGVPAPAATPAQQAAGPQQTAANGPQPPASGQQPAAAPPRQATAPQAGAPATAPTAQPTPARTPGAAPATFAPVAPGPLAAGPAQAAPAELAAIATLLADPTAIAAVPGKHLCAPALVTKLLAEQRPETLRALASALLAGKPYELPDGRKVTLSPKNAAWIDAQPWSAAAKLQARLQAGLMEAALGAGRYDLAADHPLDANGQPLPPGLHVDELQGLANGLLGTRLLDPRQVAAALDEAYAKLEQARTFRPTDELMAELLAQELAREARTGQSGLLVLVEAILQGEEQAVADLAKSSHLFMVVGLDEAANTVTVIDARGKKRTVDRTRFAEAMKRGEVPEDLAGIGSPFGAGF